MRKILPFIIATVLFSGMLWYLLSGRFGRRPDIAKARQGATFSFFVFNTRANITVFDKMTRDAKDAVNEIGQTLSLLHSTVNSYDPDSELSHLNMQAAKEPFKCSDMLWDILMQSKTAWNMSGKLFDVTVGPLVKLWKFHVEQNRYPDKEAVAAVLRHVGMDKLILNADEHTVKFAAPGMNMDFGGIAKGYALNLARSIAAKHNLKNYRLNFGGNIYCSQDRDIGIQDPRNPDGVVHSLKLRGQCIATSGNYEQKRYIDGKLISHIVDPRTGYPCNAPEGYESVTAVTPSATLSDVYSTTAFVGGPQTAQTLANASADTYFVFVAYTADGQPAITVVDDKAPSTTP